MQLIDQKTKALMEECKRRARAAGLEIHSSTLEYIVTNQDINELRPKIMIPTLYDFWVHDVDVVRNKWVYGVYPHNPYETVVNTRPILSFYNDNNPDWLNVMIFYHVLGHIDFFQNNIFFRHTWNDDFCGQALADKRLLNRIREELGAEKRWVDYVIEFARALDNLVGYYAELEEFDRGQRAGVLAPYSKKINFYFGDFLRRMYEKKEIDLSFYYGENKRYNRCLKEFGEDGVEAAFFGDHGFRSKFPEFNEVFKKSRKKKEKKPKPKDILQHLLFNSPFLKKEKNEWMKDVIGVIRKTSLYFQAQLRDHVCNEGWASFWHERLFLADERISGHEVDYARINAGVLVNPRVGFNPYMIGKQLLGFIEDMACKGKLSYEYQLLKNSEERKRFDKRLGEEYGRAALFDIRTNFDDAQLINFLSDEDFQDFIDKNNLFVAGQRLSPNKWGVVEVFVKSRLGRDYRDMINKTLYHPPRVFFQEDKAKEGELYLNHKFEGRTLVTKYIPAVLTGLSFLWGGKVHLETTEFKMEPRNEFKAFFDPDYEREYKKERVLYTCEGKNVKKKVIA